MRTEITQRIADDSLYAVIGFGGSKQRKGSDFFAKILSARGQKILMESIAQRKKTCNVVGEFPFLLNYDLQGGVIANFVKVQENGLPDRRLNTNCALVMDAMRVDAETRERFMNFARAARLGTEFRAPWPRKSKRIEFTPRLEGI